MSWFNWYGLIVVVGIMIPNIIYMLFQKNKTANTYTNRSIQIIEQVSRYACMIFMFILIPVVSKGFWFNDAKLVYIILNCLLVLMYWLGWFIFWKTNSQLKALTLSVLPSLIFLISGILTLNIPLIAFSCLFAYCHILISYKNANKKL